ncbi:hypothetical protein BsWGS_15051 [Bradybaena similaris]
MNTIQPLPADVRARVRTGVALTSFAQAVEELVLNSIDAGASSVAVRVDLTCFRIQVVDNGKGISLDQFQLIGERYSTSKCHTAEDLENLKYYGYRGEALASLRTAASFLEIVSRSRSSVITHSKCFQNGAALGVIQASLSRPSVGTTVTAHDLFYNLPVRRKRVNSVLEMEKIRYRLAGIALIWPQISFSLRDDSAGHVILQTYKSSGMATSFSYIFTPARARGLMEVAAEQDAFKLTGLVSKETYSRKDLQFVFINKRLVLKSSIHRQINKILGRSLILRRKGLPYEMLEKNGNTGANNNGSPQKQLERYAIFVVNVECPFSAYDITFDPSKTLVEFHDWPKLIHLLQDMLYGFLRKENLISITEPASSTSPCDVNDNDEVDDEDDDNCQRNPNSENGLNNENEGAQINVPLEALHKSRKNMSTFLENGLFSKTVHRPINQIQVKGIVPEEQTKSMASSCGQCQKSSLSEQLQHNTCSKETDVLNVNQQSIGTHSSVFSTSHPHNTGYCQQKSVQTCSNSFAQQEENVANTKQVYHQFAPNTSKGQSDSQSSLLYKHSSEIKTITKPGLHSTKHSLCEEKNSEEVIIKKPALSKRSEISLGSSVQYSSTLKSLRDMNPVSSSSKVSEIITNTLQQLRCATQKSVKNVEDLYKTPQKSTVSIDGGLLSVSHLKMENNEVTTANQLTMAKHVSKTYANMQNKELRASISHNYNLTQASNNQFCTENKAVLNNSISLRSKPQSFLTFKATKEDRSIGESDRANGQKRPSCHNRSHASKLAKLMRGESVDENCQEMRNKDSDEACSMPYTKILNAFNYNKQKKTVCFKHVNTNKGFTSSPCISSESLKECEEAGFTEDSLAWSTDYAKHFLRKRGKGTSGGHDTERGDLDVPSSSNTKLLCSKAACQRCCCCQTIHQNSRQLNHVGRSLPFSMYKTDNDIQNLEAENNSPKVSVILSLPLDDSESNTSHAENFTRIAKNKPALLSNHKNAHTISSDHGHSFVGGKVNVNGPPVVMPFHNHRIICDKNKDNKMHNMETNSKHTPDQRLPDTELIIAEECLGEDHLDIESQSEVEARRFGSTVSTPQMSQGFTVTMTQLDKDDSEGLSDDLSSACQPHCTNSGNNDESPDKCESSGFSPSEVSSPSPEESSPWIQPDLNTSVHCLQSKITDGPEARANYVTLSDSDTEIYIQNGKITEPIHTLTDSLACEETLSSQEADLDTQLQKDAKLTSIYCNSGSVVTSSAVPNIANRNINSVVENTQEEQVNLPATVCATTLAIEGYQLNQKSMIQTFQAFADPNPIPVIGTEDVERVEVGSISDSVPKTGLKLVDSGKDDKESVFVNEYYEDKNDFSNIRHMISDAKQMFKNMREFVAATNPTQNPFMHAFNIEKASVTSLPGHAFDHGRDFPEHVTGIIACDNLDGSEAHSSKTYIENQIINCELRPLPKALDKDTFQGSLRSDLYSSNETYKRRRNSGDISDVNTRFLPFDSNYRDAEHKVCGDSSISLKDGFDLFSGQICNSSNSLRFQATSTVLNNVNEEMLAHSFNCVNEKNYVRKPEFLCGEAKIDNYDSDSKQEFAEVEHKHTLTQNNCKNPNMLDSEAHLQIEEPSLLLQIEEPSLLLDRRHTDSETDQADSMSSEGDRLLMMINESVLSPRIKSGKCESSSRENSFTSECLSPEKASFLSRSEGMALDDVPSEIGQSIVTAEAVYSNDTVMDTNCRVAENVNYQTSGSEIGLRHFDGTISNRSHSLECHQSVLVPSSLSLIRSDKLTEKSNTTFHPGNMHLQDVPFVNTDTAFAAVLSATNQNTLPVTAENAADQGIQMEDISSSKDKTVVEIDTQLNKTDDNCQEEITEAACWKEVVDPETGTRTFVSNLSGHTVNEEQWRQLSSQTQKEMLGIHSECAAVPAVNGPDVFSAGEKQAFQDLVTNHFEQEDNEALSKWRNGERPVYDKHPEADISSLMAKWNNPVFLNYKQPGVLADTCPSDAVPRSCFNSLSSVEFTKNILDKVTVIGQLDNKFIVSLIDCTESVSKATKPKCSSLLVLFDQHAVHERIRLEHFTKECYEVESGERTDRIKRSEIKPAQSITMDQDDLRIMKAFSTEFIRIGINFSVDKMSRNTVHITSLPLCLMEKDASELKKNKIASVLETVESLIKEHIELLKSTNGACGRLPLTIHKALCSQACHGAVKFGDKLTIQECQDLLSSLASCNLPFQCAHGRPSLAPLVNLDAVERELLSMRRPPNLWRISQYIKKH